MIHLIQFLILMIFSVLIGCGNSDSQTHQSTQEEDHTSTQEEEAQARIDGWYELRDDAISMYGPNLDGMPVIAETDEQWMSISMGQLDGISDRFGWFRGELGASGAYFHPENNVHNYFHHGSCVIREVFWPELTPEMATQIDHLCLSGAVWIPGILIEVDGSVGLLTWYVPVVQRRDFWAE